MWRLIVISENGGQNVKDASEIKIYLEEVEGDECEFLKQVVS